MSERQLELPYGIVPYRHSEVSVRFERPKDMDDATWFQFVDSFTYLAAKMRLALMALAFRIEDES